MWSVIVCPLGSYRPQSRRHTASVNPHLIVSFMVSVSRIEKVEVALPGEPFHLPCRSRFGVADYVSWYHNGRHIAVDYRKYVLTKQDGLLVMDSGETDGGEYMCTASSGLILHQYEVNVPGKFTHSLQ